MTRLGFRLTRERPRSPDLTSFKPDAQAVEERPIPWLARRVLHVIVLLVVTAILWAAVSEVDRIVVAQGRVVTSQPLIVVQPLETSVIRTLDVAPGGTVHAGDLLGTLDPTFAAADVAALEERLASLRAESDRLGAEIRGVPYAPAADDRYAAAQLSIHRQRTAEYRARIASFEAEEARLATLLAANRDAQQSLTSRLKLLDNVEAMRAELLRRNVGSQLQLMEAQLNNLAMREQLAAKQAEERDTAHRIELSAIGREAYQREWYRERNESLLTVSREIDRFVQELAKAKRRSSLVELRAPADGVVLEIAQRSVGSVAREAEALFTLVPLGVPLEVEAEIGSADIGRVRVHDPVRIKLEALPFQRHGTVSGNVRVVSEDAFRHEDGKGAPYFRSRIAIEAVELRNVPPDFRLIPGMAATAEIVIGTRSVLSYFLYPVLRVFDESLREP